LALPEVWKKGPGGHCAKACEEAKGVGRHCAEACKEAGLKAV